MKDTTYTPTQAGTAAKHTAGPWHEGGCNLISVYGADGIQLAVVSDRDKATPADKANARLVASAPELLEALEDCLALIVNGVNGCDDSAYRITEQTRKAIAKAKGEL